MIPSTVAAREYLDAQPEERRIPDALTKIRERVSEDGRYLAVLDDDPTGTQTVHGVPVLTTWSVEDLHWALTQPEPTFYILTNSRSFPEEEAVEMNWEIASNLTVAAAKGQVRSSLSQAVATPPCAATTRLRPTR